MVNDKLSDYVSRCSAGSGIVPLDPDLAYSIGAGHIWHVRNSIARDLNDPGLDLLALESGFASYRVRADGRSFRLLAKSASRLWARIEETFGVKVAAITPESEIAMEPGAEPAKGEGWDDDQPPAHSCEARRQWFAARGLTDPVYREPARASKSNW
jgi:hypothetical protein